MDVRRVLGKGKYIWLILWVGMMGVFLWESVAGGIGEELQEYGENGIEEYSFKDGLLKAEENETDINGIGVRYEEDVSGDPERGVTFTEEGFIVSFTGIGNGMSGGWTWETVNDSLVSLDQLEKKDVEAYLEEGNALEKIRDYEFIFMGLYMMYWLFIYGIGVVVSKGTIDLVYKKNKGTKENKVRYVVYSLVISGSFIGMVWGVVHGIDSYMIVSLWGTLIGSILFSIMFIGKKRKSRLLETKATKRDKQ